MGNPFYVHVLNAFSRRLQALGRQILMLTVDPGAAADDAILRALGYQIDAVILTAAQLSTRMTSLCHERGIPIVLFNRYIPGSDASGVRCDNVAGGRLIAEAFLAAGARSFAMITGDPRGTTSQDRVRGFVEGLLEGGIKRKDIEEAPGLSSYDGAGAAALSLFEQRNRKRPDALFGVNDIMAMGAMDALRDRFGLRIPKDLLVAGFDNIPEGARAPYRLTTVRSTDRGHGRADARPHASRQPGRTDRARRRYAAAGAHGLARDGAEAAGLCRPRGGRARADPAYSAASRTGGS